MNAAEKSERREELHRHVSELEAFVVDALRRGAQSKEMREICEDAVEHSRRKATILQSKDSSLFLSALEQVREEIGKLPEVTATNAEVMEEVEHGARPKGPSEEVEASVQSVAGPGFEREREQLSHIPLSGLSSEAPSARTPVAPQPAASAAEVVQPIRQFAAEVSEEYRRRPGPSLRALSMGIQRNRSSDFRKSREYDFEAATSPRGAYYMTPQDFDPFRPGSSGSSDINAPFSMSGAPITTDYMLSSPRARATQSLPASGSREVFEFSSTSEEEGQEMEGGGEEEEEEEEEKEEAAPEELVGGRGAAVAAASEAGRPPRPVQGGRGAAAAEGAHCAAGVPPGINPLAVVEVRGHSDLDNPTTPTTNLDLPTAGEEDIFEGDMWDEGVGSMTPPKHLLLRLAESIKRLSV